MSKTLKLYYITDKYINYLRTFDKNVYYNKNSSRPYIGIVFKSINGMDYFAPLSSPKEKHLRMNPKQIDIYKIDDGKLGIININNMIPIPLTEITEAIKQTKDRKYKNLLSEQLTVINNDKRSLLNKIKNFQTMYWKHHLNQNILNRTCNFPLLEEKCEEWINIQNQQNSTYNTEDDEEEM